MAGSSISELILFIAALSVAATVSGVMITTVGGIATAVDDRGTNVAGDINTDIEIISDPGTGAVYDDTRENELHLLVKNTGERDFPGTGAATEVLVDGRYVSSDAYRTTLMADASSFDDGAVLRIEIDPDATNNIDTPLATGDHTATVIIRSERETLEFRV